MAQAAYPSAIRAASLHSYLALLRVGFTLPLMLPSARCALTAPFHPYQPPYEYDGGGIFSVALSIGSRRPGVTWHSALWSPDFPLEIEFRAVVWPTFPSILTYRARFYTVIRDAFRVNFVNPVLVHITRSSFAL